MNQHPVWRTPRPLTDDQLKLVEAADTHLTTAYWPLNALVALVALWRGLDWRWWQKLLGLPWIVLFSAWTTPTTRTTGTLITAAIWNTDMVDNLVYLHARKGVVQLMPEPEVPTFLGDFLAAVFVNTGAGTDYAGFTFVVPDDFTSADSIEMLVVSDTSTTIEYDVTTDYHNPDNTEAYNNHSGALTNQTVAMTINVPKLISISGAFASLAAGDVCGVKILNSTGANAATWYVLMFRMIYARS